MRMLPRAMASSERNARWITYAMADVRKVLARVAGVLAMGLQPQIQEVGYG